MELLCVCGALNYGHLPGACVCSRCGRVWIYKRTEFDNDWRCIKEPKRGSEASWPPPLDDVLRDAGIKRNEERERQRGADGVRYLQG